jgi:hypothetical protein
VQYTEAEPEYDFLIFFECDENIIQLWDYLR